MRTGVVGRGAPRGGQRAAASTPSRAQRPSRNLGTLVRRGLHQNHEDHDRASGEAFAPGTLDDYLRRLEAAAPSPSSPSSSSGPNLVHLVGTGPGDPELLTLKAVRLLQSADVVLYDRLISSEVLEYAASDALMIYVGKERGLHTRSQDEIHELLYRFCASGKTVVRLKGGDPYVFGRGGEELDYLQQRGVEVACVPGITAASGISSALGIPLTHRGIADNVQFITGHLRGEFTEEKLRELANKVAFENTTIVIYMGLSSLPQMSRELMDHGMDPETAAVAVERGTMANQRTVFAPLGSLTEMVEDAALESPTLIVVGNVVTLCPLWRERRGEEVADKDVQKEMKEKRAGGERGTGPKKGEALLK